MENMRVMSNASLEPWIGNAIDLTLSDGTHRIGLLQRVDGKWAQLSAGRGMPAILDGGKVLISDMISIVRASRNWSAHRRRGESMASHPAVPLHLRAAEHHRFAADYHELAGKRYEAGDHAQAAHYALLAQAHALHAGGFMSDAAKIHAERHGGDKTLPLLIVTLNRTEFLGAAGAAPAILLNRPVKPVVLATANGDQFRNGGRRRASSGVPRDRSR